MTRTPLTPLLALLGLGLALGGAACGDKDAGDTGTPGDGGAAGDGGGGGDGGDTGGTTWPDEDEDGYGSNVDCDDEDPAVHPGAEEICNGKDDDCDPATSEADWITIDSTSYASIPEALAAAVAGDLIQVCSGTFPGPLVLDKPITLMSGAGAEYSILDGSGTAGSVVEIRSDDVILHGFSIIGGTGADHRGEGDLQGGGLYVGSVQGVVVAETWIYDNTAGRGGGVFVDEGAAPSFTYVIVASNEAEDGAGLYAHAARVTLGSSEVYGNVATGQGGGMSGYEADYVVNTGIITQNQAAQGGGAAVVDDSSLSSTGSDWGEDGEEDNLPDDIWTEGGGYGDYGEGSTFSCNAAGCE